jgi:quercetin dioxygenase-like cupin family protein
MIWRTTLAVGAMIAAPLTVALAQNAPPHAAMDAPATIQFRDLKWQQTNPERGANSPQVAILHESPRATELLIRNPKNFHVPRHWHSADETLLVLQGSFIVKHDGDEQRMTLTPGGALAWVPANMIHEAWTPPDQDTVLYVTTAGKFDINWVDNQPTQ